LTEICVNLEEEGPNVVLILKQFFDKSPSHIIQ